MRAVQQRRPHRGPNPPQELVTELASIRANAQGGLAELRNLLGLGVVRCGQARV